MVKPKFRIKIKPSTVCEVLFLIAVFGVVAVFAVLSRKG